MENKAEIERLFSDVISSNKPEFSELMFNLYEDKNCYSMEAIFDDEAVIIGRELPVEICDAEKHFTEVLKDIKPVLSEFYKSNKANLSNIKEISYGFVDGDLHYIKRKRQKKNTAKIFTEKDFEAFNDVKLRAWLSVYTDEQKREDNGIDTFVLNKLAEEERIKYRRFLAENFDYDKYNKN